ncbi:hypothetical protein WN944_015279 [Citrus x changshan-huyou]|uniref:Uncharacterized protein n=1 Tax=Citrus x changshan-huyou TaxID=2935761 RepID=A0AAP0M8M1_9ROSI
MFVAIYQILVGKGLSANIFFPTECFGDKPNFGHNMSSLLSSLKVIIK